MNHPAVTPPKPSLIKALLSGFETVSNHLGLILFSVILDLFIWFGLRLSVFSLIKDLFIEITDAPEMQVPDMETTIAMAREYWIALAESLNLFNFLRTFPVGIPSLMILKSPAQTPVSLPTVWEVPSAVTAAGIVLLLILVGLFTGTLYFFLVCDITIQRRFSASRVLKDGLWASGQVFLLALITLFVVLATLVPLSCVLSVLFFSGVGTGLISMVVLFIFLAIMMWWLLPVFFAPHGVFIHRYNIITSIRNGIRMTRFTLPSSALLVIVVILLSEGLNLLWQMPPGSSWFALIGVLGHAFISTSLLAATFIYYYDADLWVKDVLERAERMTA